MFFSETFKQWQENRALEKDLALLEKKTKARKETIYTGFLVFIFGVLGTMVLSGILYMMIYMDQLILNDSGETMSTILTLGIGYKLPIYFSLVGGIIYMLLMTFNSLWIFLKFIFVQVKNYDFENEPSFRA